MWNKTCLLMSPSLFCLGFPAQLVKNLPAMQETRVQFLGWENPLEKEMESTAIFLSGKSMDRGAWWATVHGVARVGHNLAIKLPL